MHFVAVLLFLGVSGAFIAPAEVAEDDEFDAVHHTADAYYLDFLPIGKLELPRIFIVRSEEEGLKMHFFMSTASALRSPLMEADKETPDESHGEESAGSDDVEALIMSGKHLDAHIVPNNGSVVLDLSMTKHLVFALLASGFLLFVFIRLANRYKAGIGRVTAPQGLIQNLSETLIIFVRDEIAIPNLGKDKYPRYFPFLLTAFFFILTCNLLGLVPFGANSHFKSEYHGRPCSLHVYSDPGEWIT